MLNLITFFSFAFVAYVYFGYPVILSFLPTRRKREKTLAAPKSFCFIIAARNEEKVIAERIENLLAVSAPSGALVEYLVCSDASDDRTNEIVQSFESKGIRLIVSPERKGKEYAQRLGVQSSAAEILVFTDANVKTDSDILLRLSEHFRDPEVGGVSSIDRVESLGDVASGESTYVQYEMWLRGLESGFNSLVGLSGSCFAVRKDVAQDLREDAPSDFSLLIEIVRQKQIGIIAEDIVCSYQAVKTEEQEFARKVRTVLRGISALFSVREILDYNKFGIFTWQIASHKLGRWLVPWFLISGSWGAFKLSETSSWWAFVSVGLLIFYGLATYAFVHKPAREQKLYKLPLFFLVTNCAILVAWVRYLRGDKNIIWDPSVR